MKLLRRVVLCVLVMCSITMSSISVSAQSSLSTNSNQVFVTTGYTSDGVKYDVYKNIQIVEPKSIINKFISTKVVYQSSTVIPERTIVWTEDLDSYTTLTGLLYLVYYERNPNGTTTALYEGTITGRV